MTAPPYRSQWASPDWVRRIIEGDADPCDDPAWQTLGFDRAVEYRYWAKRTCGLACLESILTHAEHTTPPRVELVRSALKWGAYRHRPDGTLEGLTYQPFVDWIASDFGLNAEAYGYLDVHQVVHAAADDSFVIASVSPEIRYPAQPNQRVGGHLVLVHGADRSGERDSLQLHNPSGVPPYQADARLDVETFSRFFANRGVIVHR